jgi:hypothetical protein
VGGEVSASRCLPDFNELNELAVADEARLLDGLDAVASDTLTEPPAAHVPFESEQFVADLESHLLASQEPALRTTCEEASPQLSGWTLDLAESSLFAPHLLFPAAADLVLIADELEVPPHRGPVCEMPLGGDSLPSHANAWVRDWQGEPWDRSATLLSEPAHARASVEASVERRDEPTSSQKDRSAVNSRQTRSIERRSSHRAGRRFDPAQNAGVLNPARGTRANWSDPVYEVHRLVSPHAGLIVTIALVLSAGLLCWLTVGSHPASPRGPGATTHRGSWQEEALDLARQSGRWHGVSNASQTESFGLNGTLGETTASFHPLGPAHLDVSDDARESHDTAMPQGTQSPRPPRGEATAVEDTVASRLPESSVTTPAPRDLAATQMNEESILPTPQTPSPYPRTPHRAIEHRLGSPVAPAGTRR